MTICLTGFMGCGKSSVGRALSEALGFPFTDLDDYIVRMSGRTIAQIFTGGEADFRDIELRALREVLGKVCGRDWVLSLGGGTLTGEEARDLIFGKTTTVYLRARMDTIMQRLQGEVDSRPMLRDGKAGELLERRRAVYEMADYVIDTDGKDVPAIVSEIKDVIQL